jgi:hypothetical protein
MILTAAARLRPEMRDEALAAARGVQEASCVDGPVTVTRFEVADRGES